MKSKITRFIQQQKKNKKRHPVVCDSFWSEGAVEVWRSRPAQAGQTAEAFCVGAVWPGLEEANTAKTKRPSCRAEERWTKLSWERMGPEGHSFSWLEPEKHCTPETGQTVSLQSDCRRPLRAKGGTCALPTVGRQPFFMCESSRKMSRKKYPNSLSLESVSLVKWSPKEFWSL